MKEIKYLDEICEMLSKDKDTFIKECVERELYNYLNSDGEFKPVKGKVEYAGSGTRDCMILDPNITIFGEKYVKIYDFEQKNIVKTLENQVERIAEKEDTQEE